MLFFSVFCFLGATPTPLDVVHVKDTIYKNERHRIAAFAGNQPDAKNYAGILHAKNQTPGTSTIEINRVIGSFRVQQAYQTHGGWIVNHYENTTQTGRLFNSYVVSAAASWRDLEATISTTLTQFMQGYNQAFPPTTTPKVTLPAPEATALVEQLSRLSLQPADAIMDNLACLQAGSARFTEDETGMLQVLSCHADLKKIREKLSRALKATTTKYSSEKNMSLDKVSRFYQICCGPSSHSDQKKRATEKERLKARDITEEEIVAFRNDFDGKLLIQLKINLDQLSSSSYLASALEIEMKRIWGSVLNQKAKENEYFVFDAREDGQFNNLCLTKTAPELLQYLKEQAKFFQLKSNGAWGRNNCLLESIGQTPGAFRPNTRCLREGNSGISSNGGCSKTSSR